MHELKNMLQVVRSLVTLAARDAEQTRGRYRDIEASVERMDRALRDYLAVARPPPPPVPFAVETAAAEAMAMVAPRAVVAGVTLEHQLDGGHVQGQPARLREAIANLIGNAIEASAAGARVVVRSRLDGDRVVIEILDDGRGLSEEIRDRIGVEAFTTRPGGSGLGVMLARAVIGQHGGTLDYRDNASGGTIARIVLPLRP